MNFLWSGSSHRTRIRVSWTNCCSAKGKGGLGLIDPQEAMEALMAKWILKAPQPEASNLQTFLRYRLQKLKPATRGTWSPSIQWTLTHQFSAPRGYRIWNRMMQGWKKFSKKLEMSTPTNAAEVLSTPLWWTTHFYAGNFGFSLAEATRLMKSGITHIRDLWNGAGQICYTCKELTQRYQLGRVDRNSFNRMLDAIPHRWIQMLTNGREVTRAGDFVGIFHQIHDTIPSYICELLATFLPQLMAAPVALNLVQAKACYIAGPQSKLFMQADVPIDRVQGYLKRVRIVHIPRGQPRKLKIFLMYAGIIQDLVFDPGRYHWHQNLGVLHSFSANKGRTQILHQRSDLQRTIPNSYKPNWKEVWLSRRPQKEAGFLWSVYHRAIAVNQWKSQMFRRIFPLYVCCPQQSNELVKHCMYECPRAATVWCYAQTILFTVQGTNPENGSWPSFTFQQCVFGSRLPRRIK
jgi:hypothetical protein